MRRNFERGLSAVLEHEGGYVNHPHDPGGATNLGVTIGTARRLGIDLDGDGDTDVVDIKLLKPSDAAKVYRAEYWNKVSGDDLPDGLDYATFDFAVNSGVSRAAKYLQRIVGVSQDGVIGPQTLAAVNAADPRKLITQLCDDRLAFLRRLSTWDTFGKGWGRRVQGVRALAMDMHEKAPQPAQEPPKPIPRPDGPDKAKTPASGKPAGKAKAVGTGAVILAVLFAVGKALGIF